MTRLEASTKFSLRTAALAACVALFPIQSQAAWPTIDWSSLGRLSSQTTIMSNQQASLEKIKKETEDTQNAIGDAGPQGAASFSPASDSFYDTLQKFAFDPCAINLCTVGTNYTNEQDYDRAVEWAQRNFFAGKALEPSAMRDLVEVRRRAVIYTSTSGLAMANIVQNKLANAGADADQLEAEVAQAEEMRKDIRANSLILLAAYKLEVQKMALLAGMLAVESTNAMVQTTPYFELGGDEFPDAFIEDDFGGDMTKRVTVSTPSKGVAVPAPNL